MASSSSGMTSRLGLADAWGKLRSLRFNQDQSCFICALDDGIRVFYLDPIRELTHLRYINNILLLLLNHFLVR